jgi:RHS repeat-associated protein
LIIKILRTIDYQWDAASRIVSMNDGKYNYDKTNQLIAANYAKLPSEKYNYDLNGNRSNYQIGKNNHLLHDGENAYEYDGEGNRISKGTTKYFWDHRNRLIKVETPQETVEYVYDHRNRLIKRSTSKGSEFFVHDGWQIVLALDNNGSVTNKFLWGAKQDELIAQNSAYTLCDHLGTVRDLIGNGATAHFEYNAFGQLLLKTGNADSLFKYTGKMTDEITGLQWNINRWYDAKMGKWIAEDPIGFMSRSVNLTKYVDNYTNEWIDPYGLVATQSSQKFERIDTLVIPAFHTWAAASYTWGTQNVGWGVVDYKVAAWGSSSLVPKPNPECKWKVEFEFRYRLIGGSVTAQHPVIDLMAMNHGATVQDYVDELFKHEQTFHYFGGIVTTTNMINGMQFFEGIFYDSKGDADLAISYATATVSEMRTKWGYYHHNVFDPAYSTEMNAKKPGFPTDAYNLQKVVEFWDVFHSNPARTQFLSNINPA